MSSRLGRPLSEIAGVAGAGLLVAALFLPSWALVPGASLDPGWVLGLSWAHDLALAWGTDVVFTYGPLGWLMNPMAFARDQVVLSLLVHTTATVAALFIAEYMARTWLGLSRWLALIGAAIATSVSLAAAPFPATLVLLVFGSMAMLVRGRWWMLAATAVALGILGHQKLSDATVGLAFAFICAYGGLGWRGALGLAGITGATWLGIWLGLGFGFGLAGLADYIAASLDVILGYASAMATEAEDMVLHLAAAILIALLAIIQAFEAGRAMGRRQRVSLVAAFALALYLFMRAGFTRHDVGHVYTFAGYAIVLGVALILATKARLKHGYGVAAVVIGLCFQGVLLTWTVSFSVFDRGASLQALDKVAIVLTDNDLRASMLEKASSDLVSHYQLTPEIVDALRGAEVAVDPWDVSAAWAAGAAWRPLPVFQAYQAYTPGLDRRNAAHLGHRPRLILQPAWRQSIDGRNPAWETPAVRRLLYCDYGLALASDTWQVLEPQAATRCGQIGEPQAFEARAGEEIPVPQHPGTVTLATIRPHLSVYQRLLSTLAIPPPILIDYRGVTWRWAYGDAAERIMLNAPVKDPAFPDLPASPHPTISVNVPATVTFESMPIQAPGQGTPGEVSYDIRDIVVAPAGADQRSSVVPKVLFSNSVAVTDDGTCLLVSATGDDPYIAMDVPEGAGLKVTSYPGGDARVFLDAGGYSGNQSAPLTLGTDPYFVYMPPGSKEGGWGIRIDPPDGQDSKICQVPVTLVPHGPTEN